MKLIDLDPRWLHKNKIFTFRCPHCWKQWLTCKRVPMSHQQQWSIFEQTCAKETWDPGWPVGCKPEVAWTFSNFDFATMSITPSLDASPSGHWHGHITSGIIVGGEQCNIADAALNFKQTQEAREK